MQQIIKNKTLELLDRLSDQHMYFTPNDLIEAGYPNFLVERIRLEIERNLADSVTLPESEWADMRADQVQDAWDHFLLAIRAETRIPVSYCKNVIENAVEDVLDLFSKPRNYILETLFRNENEARLDELTSRRKWIVVHGVLADSILRYMQRKNLTTLSHEKAEYVLVEVDKKLTSGFTPLKWAQHLELLFEFLDNQVPSQILSEYFVDRGMMSESKQIDRGNEFVTRTTFIEMISEAGIYQDDDVYEADELKATYEEKITVKSADETSTEDLNDDDQINDTETQTVTNFVGETSAQKSIIDSINEKDFTIKPDFRYNSTDDSSISSNDDDIIEKIGSQDEIQAEESTSNKDFVTLEEAFELDQPTTSDESDSILNAFLQPDDVDEEQVEEKSDYSDKNEPFKEESEEFVSLADQFLMNSDDEVEDTVSSQLSDEGGETTSTNSDFSTPETSIEEETNSDFAKEDDSFESTGLNESFSQNAQEDIGIVEESITESSLVQSEKEVPETSGISTPENSDNLDDDSHVIYLTDRAKQLLAILEPNLEEFIIEVFLNDELEFYKHLENISSYSEWRMAGRYITRDVFDKNRIDLYSEPAVMFTDAVQEFFDQNEN